MANKWLCAGDVIMLDASHSVYLEKYSGVKKLSDKDWQCLHGKYIVTHAGLGGGGTGHGPHDVYHDGWHVTCQKVDDPEVRVSFYQSGCFTCVNETIKAIGRAKQYWVIEE